MRMLDLDTYVNNRRAVAAFAIMVCLATWAFELYGFVYVCPYCRVQRSVIGILGIILLLPFCHHWIAKYFALAIGFFGAAVASTQHFMGWRKISANEFTFNSTFAADPTLLSGFAVFVIVGLVSLILLQSREKHS